MREQQRWRDEHLRGWGPGSREQGCCFGQESPSSGSVSRLIKGEFRTLV